MEEEERKHTLARIGRLDTVIIDSYPTPRRPLCTRRTTCSSTLLLSFIPSITVVTIVVVIVVDVW